MKRWLVRLVALSAFGAVGFWGWGLLFPSAEQVIRKQLIELAKVASIRPNESPLTKLAHAQRLSSLFAADAQLTLDMPGRSTQTLNGRDEVLQAAGYARSLLNTLRLKFVDIIVRVGPDKQSALAHITATADLPGERLPEVQELEISFRKTDHDWLINRVEPIKTLR